MSQVKDMRLPQIHTAHKWQHRMVMMQAISTQALPVTQWVIVVAHQITVRCLEVLALTVVALTVVALMALVLTGRVKEDMVVPMVAIQVMAVTVLNQECTVMAG